MLGCHPFDSIKTQEELTDHLLKLYKGIENVTIKIKDPLLNRVVESMLQPVPSQQANLPYLEKLLK